MSEFSDAPAAGSNPWWRDPPSGGDYASDCDEGARRADTFLQQLQMGEKKYVLGWMVRDMMADRRLTGLEVGFFHRLSEYLALVPHNASLILHLSDRRKIGEGEPWMQPSSTSC